MRRVWGAHNLDTFLNACDKVDRRLRQVVDEELGNIDKSLLSDVNLKPRVRVYESNLVMNLLRGRGL